MSVKKVYLAEDSPTQALFVRSILKNNAELEVQVLEDGLAIYRTVLENPPDLLILDIILPNLTGLAVCRLLKFHDRFKSLPLLMVSSINDPDIAERALKVGADEFMHKPLKKAELLAAVERLFSKT